MAVLLSQIIHVRILTAFISHVVAMSITFHLRDVSSASALGWRLLIERPASSLFSPLLHGSSWRVPDVIGTMGLCSAFVAPLVFAYCVAWQWTPRPSQTHLKLRRVQLPLKAFLVGLTLCCLGLGFQHWLDAQIIAVYPIAVTAICLAIRPIELTTRLGEDWRDGKRLVDLRKRIRHGPEMFWHQRP